MYTGLHVILTKPEFSQFIFEQTGQCTYNLTLRRICLTNILWKCKKCYLICVCVYLQPSISSVKRTCALLSAVAFPALQYFYTVPHERAEFRKNRY